MKKLIVTLVILIGLLGGDLMLDRRIVCGEPRINLKVAKIGAPIEFVKIVPETVMVGKTVAQQNVPSSFYLDLRLYSDSNHERHITADWLTLHDASSSNNTIGITSVDLVNNVSTAGPIINGRDQAAVFGTAWVNFYIIYNPDAQIVASLSSLSATAPTLPAGYTFFVRVGAAYTFNSLFLSYPYDSIQHGGRIWFHQPVFADQAPAFADTWESVSLAVVLPPTAIQVFGYFGLSTNPTVARGMGIASDSSGGSYIMTSLDAGGIVAGYNTRSLIHFDLPLITAQTMWWKASSTQSVYYLKVTGYTDDI